MFKKPTNIQLLLIAVLLTVIFPVIRVGCFDGCSWVVTSLILPATIGDVQIALLGYTVGIFFIIPYVVVAIEIAIFYILLLIARKYVQSKIMWRVAIAIVGLVGTFLILSVGYSVHEPTRESINNASYFMKNSFRQYEIGMTKEAFLAIHPDALEERGFRGPIWDFSHPSEYPFEILTRGTDCLLSQEQPPERSVSVCFRNNQAYIVGRDRRMKYHNDYSKHIVDYAVTSTTSCEGIHDAPYYLGEPSLDRCYQAVAVVAKDISYCERMSSSRELTECIVEFVSEYGEVSLCDRINDITDEPYSIDWRSCVLRGAYAEKDPSVCDKLLESPRENTAYCKAKTERRARESR